MENYTVNDVHIHVGKSNGIYRSLEFDQLLPFLEKYEINEIALFPFDVNPEIDNFKIISLAKQHKFIHGLYWILKNRVSKDQKILEKELHDGLIGVKFHGVYEELPVSSEVYQPIMETLNDKGAILLVHCGRYKDGHPDSTSSYIHPLKIAEKYPKIKVIMGHMGGNDTSVVRKAVNAAIEYRNVFFETSGISTPFRVEYAVKILGADRILFGSDYPWCSFRGNFYNVEDSLLDEKSKIKIFSENFNKLIM